MKKIILLALASLFLLNGIEARAQRIENSSRSTIAYIQADGRIENSNHSYIGYVRDDGRVENSNHSCIGRVDGVSREWAAAFFFFFFN